MYLYKYFILNKVVYINFSVACLFIYPKIYHTSCYHFHKSKRITQMVNVSSQIFIVSVKIPLTAVFVTTIKNAVSIEKNKKIM